MQRTKKSQSLITQAVLNGKAAVLSKEWTHAFASCVKEYILQWEYMEVFSSCAEKMYLNVM